jgi:hypothetical protein
MVATKVHAASADGVLLQTFASRGVFACNTGQFLTPEAAKAHRETKCECGAARRGWEHYAGECVLLDTQRKILSEKLDTANRRFEREPAQYLWAGAERLMRGEGLHINEAEVIQALAVGVPCGLKGTTRSMAQKAVEGIALATAAWLRAAVDVDGPAARRAEGIADRRKTMRGTFLQWGELAARAGPSAAWLLAERRREIAAVARRQGAAHTGLGGLPVCLLRAVLQCKCGVGARPHPRKVAGGE